MKNIIKIKQNQPQQDCFSFGNIASEYNANSLYFTKNGKPYIIVSGEFHYSRYNHNEWERELLKMKANGINAVATYVMWNHHEYVKGKFDFTENNNIKEFLSICSKIDLPCILRIGPWAHAECLYGGFPPYVQKLKAKRQDSPQYMQAVEVYWRKLFEQVEQFCDGKTVLAIQLENEYDGSIAHIRKLRALAQKIGFKTPFFTMTAWPTNTADKSILATFGGYPEAPWTYHKKRLAPNGRFAISNGRMETEIGEDLIKTKKPKCSFANFPYAGCEVGVGNQVTQHRRPIISDNDGYGVAFAKFASGMNWLGYYMYHGGRNPNIRPMQESRLTFYPNNLPMIDYDFQAPFSKDGDKRKHADRLRLLHIFTCHWDKNIATKEAFFGNIAGQGGEDYSVPYFSVRCDEKMSGYMFISNYERSRTNKNIDNFEVELVADNQKLDLPKINVEAGAMFFYPFNFYIADKKIDYILAQPIIKEGNVLYFKKIAGIEPTICVEGEVKCFENEFCLATSEGNFVIKVLDDETALSLFYLDKVLFSNDNIYKKDKQIIAEVKQPETTGATLCKAKKCHLPHGYYLYSYGKRKYYTLKIEQSLLDKYDDIELEFSFSGLNLQLFAGSVLLDDYFNTDGKYKVRLKMFYKEMKDTQINNNQQNTSKAEENNQLNTNETEENNQQNTIKVENSKANNCKINDSKANKSEINSNQIVNILTIKTAPPMSYGVGKVYNEIGLKAGINEIKLEKITPIKFKTL
ncbi:MAG: beta-galactosidase [Clostridia bacterium]